MKNRSLLLCSILALVAAVPALAQAPVIQISGANFRPLPMAYPAPEGGAASEFDQAFLFDLQAAGLFQVLDRKSFTAAASDGMSASSIAFPRWRDVGAEELVKAEVVPQGGQLKVTIHLFSVAAGREDFTQTETVPAAEARRVAHTLADALYRHFTREPGPFTSRLTFVRRSGSAREIWISDWDGRNAQRVAGEGVNLLPALVPGTGEVAFTSYHRGRPELYKARAGGALVPLVLSEQMITGVAYSPDGKRIAYAHAQGDGVQIFLASADGSNPHAITDTSLFINTSPAWSPDGRMLAFVSNRAGSPQIYTMNVDGSNVRRRTFQGTYNQTPDWSPRGDLIAFTARDERNVFDLFTVNLDSGEVKRLTQDQGNNEEPTFAPNGRLIIFTSSRAGSPRLFVMTPDGSSQLQLPAEKGTYATPDWGR